MTKLAARGIDGVNVSKYSDNAKIATLELGCGGIARDFSSSTPQHGQDGHVTAALSIDVTHTDCVRMFFHRCSIVQSATFL